MTSAPFRAALPGSSPPPLNRQVSVRFLTPSGEMIEMQIESNANFSTVKDRLWQRKHWEFEKTQFALRILEGEVFFMEHQKLTDAIRINRVFDSSATVLDLLVIPKDEIGDKKKREEKKASVTGLPLCQGFLWKRNRKPTTFGSGHRWKRRWFILQDISLFYYESEEAFRTGKEAIDFLPLGSVYPLLTPDIKNGNLSFTFELDTEHVGVSKINLCAETQEDMDMWTLAVRELNFRRIKSICVNICEELDRRGSLETEGLFRLSGSKEAMQSIMKDIALGIYPNLPEVRDENALTGILKSTIREMPEPLLTFDAYKSFVHAGQASDPQQRVSKCRDALSSVPASNLELMDYLFGFLKKVASHSDKNMMTCANLSIVFAPNILKSPTESVATSMADNPHILAAVATMIEYHQQLFPEPEIEYSRTASQTVSSASSPLSPTSSSIGGPPPPLSSRVLAGQDRIGTQAPQFGNSLAAALAMRGAASTTVPPVLNSLKNSSNSPSSVSNIGPPASSPPPIDSTTAIPPPLSVNIAAASSRPPPFGSPVGANRTVPPVRATGNPPPIRINPPPFPSNSPMSASSSSPTTLAKQQSGARPSGSHSRKTSEEIASSPVSSSYISNSSMNAQGANFGNGEANPAGPPSPKLKPLNVNMNSNNSASIQSAMSTVSEHLKSLESLWIQVDAAVAARRVDIRAAYSQLLSDIQQSTGQTDLERIKSVTQQIYSMEQQASQASDAKMFEYTNQIASLATAIATANEQQAEPSPIGSPSSRTSPPSRPPQSQSADIYSSPTASRSPNPSISGPNGSAVKKPGPPPLSSQFSASNLNSNGHSSATAAPSSSSSPAASSSTPLPTSASSVPISIEGKSILCVCIARYAYVSGQRSNDMALDKGDEMEVYDKDEVKGWWMGKKIKNGNVGWFPGSYVKVKQ